MAGHGGLRLRCLVPCRTVMYRRVMSGCAGRGDARFRTSPLMVCYTLDKEAIVERKEGDVSPPNPAMRARAQQPPEGWSRIAPSRLEDPASQLAAVTAERDQLVGREGRVAGPPAAAHGGIRELPQTPRSARNRNFATSPPWKPSSVASVPGRYQSVPSRPKHRSKDYVRGMELVCRGLPRRLQKNGPGADTRGGTEVRSACSPRPGDAAERGGEEHAILAEFQEGVQFRASCCAPPLVSVAMAPASDSRQRRMSKRDYYEVLGVDRAPTCRRSRAPTARWRSSIIPTATSRQRQRRRALQGGSRGL